MAGINSGILYLETFIDQCNQLPADVQRTLGYIQTLDKRFNETRAVIEEKVQQWVEAFEHCPKPLPPEAHAQRMAIDQLHSEIIHLQEEKFVFAQQIEGAIREKVEELNGIAETLENDIAVNTPADPGTPTAAAVARGDFRTAPSFLPDDFGIAISNSLATMDHGHVPNARLGLQKKSSVRATSRKSPSMTPLGSVSGHLGGGGGGGGGHVLHSKSGALMMAGGAPPLAAPPMGLVNPALMADPLMAPPMASMMFFQPYVPGLSASSTSPQAAGRILKPHEITMALVNKQAELLWPDDKLWYLIQITHVDLASKNANILYLTGETEEDINLEEVALKGEMSIIIAPHTFY